MRKRTPGAQTDCVNELLVCASACGLFGLQSTAVKDRRACTLEAPLQGLGHAVTIPDARKAAKRLAYVKHRSLDREHADRAG